MLLFLLAWRAAGAACGAAHDMASCVRSPVFFSFKVRLFHTNLFLRALFIERMNAATTSEALFRDDKC